MGNSGQSVLAFILLSVPFRFSLAFPTLPLPELHCSGPLKRWHPRIVGPVQSSTLTLAMSGGGAGMQWADGMAKQAISGISKEFPHKVDHLWVEADGSLEAPRSLHPAFYGSYDWHSSVHSHWALARLLRICPEEIDADSVKQGLQEHINLDFIKREAEYFSHEGGKTFERPYGWGWALKLAAECAEGAREEKQEGAFRGMNEALVPLSGVICTMFKDYLPKLGYPVRSGVHSNTAFALTLSLDFAVQLSDKELEDAIRTCAKRLYGNDKAYNPQYEPSGEDFLSPGVTEMSLMRKVLPPSEFVSWAKGFLPSLFSSDSASACELLRVPIVGDRQDARLCHLDGLLLSKAWGLRMCASGFKESRDSRAAEVAQECLRAADAHYASAQWQTENYVGTHWLHSFALLALTDCDV